LIILGKPHVFESSAVYLILECWKTIAILAQKFVTVNRRWMMLQFCHLNEYILFYKAHWIMASTNKTRFRIIIFSHKIILFICCFDLIWFKFYLFWLNGKFTLQKYFYISILWLWMKSNCIYTQYGTQSKKYSIIYYLNCTQNTNGC